MINVDSADSGACVGIAVGMVSVAGITVTWGAAGTAHPTTIIVRMANRLNMDGLDGDFILPSFECEELLLGPTSGLELICAG
jgi:hypothetical protein